MMTDEKELERHNRILEQIITAQGRNELPKVNLRSIMSFLSESTTFNKKRINPVLFKPVVDELINYGYFAHPNVRTVFFKVVLENFKDISEDELINLYKKIISSKRITYLLIEIGEKNRKAYELTQQENYNIHMETMKKIEAAFEINELPTVGKVELNKRLIKAVNSNDFNQKIKISEIKILTDTYLANQGSKEIEHAIEVICSSQELNNEDKKLMGEQIFGALMLDDKIFNIIDEIKMREKRKLFIYKNNHEEIMENIKNARRISQLPPNLTFSALTNYLFSNSTIYSNDNRVKSEDFKHLTQLLLGNYHFSDDIIQKELKTIAEKYYADKDDAYELLFNKLSSLPRTAYLVEEINYSLTRQKEFIKNNCSNVNVYFVPNDKSPLEAGRFYNCYINRVDNLDLSKILPLNLDEIVPSEMDVDSIEWYVQENYDDTFKAAGGIILGKDETIGNVSIFKPNDGKVGVEPEKKQKLDTIDDLDLQIEQKKQELISLNKELGMKKQEAIDIEANLNGLVEFYSREAKELYLNFLAGLEQLQGKTTDVKKVRIKQKSNTDSE